MDLGPLCLKPGVTVKLKSAPFQLMTIAHISDSPYRYDTITTHWFDRWDNLHTGTFCPDELLVTRQP